MSPSKETETHIVYVSPQGKLINFPKRARYKRSPDRIYFSGDFADGEIVTFSNFSGNSVSTSDGNAWYFGCDCKHGRLININEIEELVDGE